MAKTRLTNIADVERLVETARSKENSSKPYTINDTVKNENGTPLDKQERTVELARSTYNKNKPYDINSV